jgi:hypothetical protein
LDRSPPPRGGGRDRRRAFGARWFAAHQHPCATVPRLVLWNLLVYLGLAIGGVRSLRAGARGAAPFTQSVARGIGHRLGPLLTRTATVDTLLGAAVHRFAADWSEAAAPLLGQHLRRWLHLGAAAVAAGLIAGLYLRGLVLRYEVGWESTFLEPPQVKALLDLLFGRLASWAGIPLPQTIEQVAELRWDGVAGGAAAAPWIHLIALCLTTIVVLPRLSSPRSPGSPAGDYS